MQQGDGGQHTWWQRHFGSGAWEDTTSSQRLAWLALGASGSLVLLGAFWFVVTEGLARADQHWEQARSPSPATSACASARPLGHTGDGCASMISEPVARRAGTTTTHLGSPPR